jgi:hypothetical protein
MFHIFCLTFKKTIRAYEKSVFSRRLLCFVKMKLRERRAAGGTRKEAGFILGFPGSLGG